MVHTVLCSHPMVKFTLCTSARLVRKTLSTKTHLLTLRTIQTRNPRSLKEHPELFIKHLDKLKTNKCWQIRAHSYKSGNERIHSSMYGYKTALVAGVVVAAGVFTKLKADSEEEDKKATSEVPVTEDDNCLSLSEAIQLSRDLLQRKKDETGSPGLVVAVTVNGRNVWSEGIGFADVENRLPCTPQSVFRIASISKSITMAMVAKLWENGDLDLDKPVQFYVKEFPEKYWEGKKVTITTRQLLSHMSGLRHYDKDYMKKETSPDAEGKEKNVSVVTDKNSKNSYINASCKDVLSPGDEMLLEEYYITQKYSSVIESLNLFKDDPLVHKPGTKFLYTTHGWTLVSAVVENVAKVPFEEYLKRTLDELGMEHTYLEENLPLIYNRGRHYSKNKQGRLINAPYVDLSYKWSGGGLVSNVLDVARFGNIMLFSYQAKGHHSGKDESAQGRRPLTFQTADQKGYLKPETVSQMWSVVSRPKSNWDGIAHGGYGLGWSVWDAKKEHPFCKEQKFIVSHTGGAVGASSVLFILPAEQGSAAGSNGGPEYLGQALPQGVVVAIIVNMMSVGLNKTAYDIAKIFQRVGEPRP